MILKLNLINTVSQAIVIGELNNIKYRIERAKETYRRKVIFMLNRFCVIKPINVITVDVG